MTKPDYVLQTYIRCTPDALWQALSDPEELARYHFMFHTIERDGETLNFYDASGTLMLVCREIEIDRAANRVVTSFEPKWDPDAVASRVVYLVAPEGDHCRLTVEHYGLQYGAEGVADGWTRMIAGLKTWLETGTPARFGDPARAAHSA